MSEAPIIRVDGLWKKYGIPSLLPRPRPLLRRLAGRAPATPRPEDEPGYWALRNLSFEVKKGENLGIIGRNGSGKSTLLKILSGVSPPTHGKATVTGRVFPMLEISAGLHPELTGRENIRLLGVVMGLSRREIEAKRPEIEEFSELGDWLDEPVLTYSSGMLGRLGFAVAVHVDADILLIDEIMGVGDFAFQKKCIARVEKLCQRGVTSIFVTHNPYMTERICDRVMLIHEGDMVEIGSPADVIHTYFELVEPSVPHKDKSPDKAIPVNRAGVGDIRVTEVSILDGSGNPISNAQTGRPLTFRFNVHAEKPFHAPNLSLRIIDHQNTLLMSAEYLGTNDGVTFDGAGFIECHVNALPLMPETYTVQVKLGSHVVEDVFYLTNWLSVTASTEVFISTGNKGLLYADVDWRLSAGKENDLISNADSD